MPQPTATEFRARHARFASLSDGTINAYLSGAAVFLDETTWRPADYTAGVMYLAAHLMHEEGAVADGEDATGASAGTSGLIKKLKADTAEIEYATPTQGSASGPGAEYMGNVYGRAFYALWKRNRVDPGPMVI